MKKLWCWRCGEEVSMLDEDEFATANRLYIDAFRKKEISLKERFNPLLEYYESITGVREMNPNTIMHHRINLYGELCENCGKPYRTPQASFCPACGNKRKEGM